jgi:hypothetical protein
LVHVDPKLKGGAMNPNPMRGPVPAIVLAVAFAVFSRKANANAARALGIPATVVALLVAGALAAGDARAG